MSLLVVHNLEKKLGRKKILHKVNFTVHKGEMYGFLGPNGAGKTTTMKTILGLIQAESGHVKVFGHEGLSLKSKKRIGFMPENTYLYKHLTGREFLKFNGSFFGYSGKELDKKVSHLLEKVGLDHAGDRFLKGYSKGMLQRVGLAQAIINEPELLFLDEPMSGLDPMGRKMVKDLMVELNKKGTTIFFNTHILSDVQSICDKFSIINHGHLIVESKKISSVEGSLEDFFVHEVSKHDKKLKKNSEG